MWQCFGEFGRREDCCAVVPEPPRSGTRACSSRHILLDSNCFSTLQCSFGATVPPTWNSINCNGFLPKVFARATSEIDPKRRALILYTSGTTNLPKGVVTTHRNLEAQITTLIKAWRWTSSDHTLCVLPLHHVHGIINVVSCSLWAGARCEFLPEFDPMKVFEIFERTGLMSLWPCPQYIINSLLPGKRPHPRIRPVYRHR